MSCSVDKLVTTPTDSAASARVGRWEVALFVSLAFAWPLVYAAITQHIWEDFFITFRHSENLADGHGLVYQPGERVHGFTSPLGTLLPAGAHWIAKHWFGATDYLPALWAFRAASAAAFAGGGLFVLLAIANESAGMVWPRRLFAVLYLLDLKGVAFSVNGMETGLMLLFLGWSIWIWQASVVMYWLAGGLAWGGLMWTRPDGCVYIAALALGTIIFGREPMARRLGAIARMALVCAMVYLPWFAWAWWYYGSPIPHTVLAKRYLPPFYGVQSRPWRVIDRARSAFAPILESFGPWPAWTWWVELLVGSFSLGYWILPVRDRLGRMASFAFLIVCLYLVVVYAFPWYLPPLAMFGSIALALGLARLVSAAQGQDATWRIAARATAFVVAAAVVANNAFITVAGTRQFAKQQAIIEDGNRRVIGRWLAEHVKPGERVFLECLGYIGYFSRAKMLDHPGLVSPEVSALVARKIGFAEEIAELKPEWLVLRPQEVSRAQADPAFSRDYQRVKLFDVEPRISAEAANVRGVDLLHFDARFEIFRRRETEPTAD